ncbi:Hypothetical protein K801_12116 [Salmonella enterica subsp. enterica serovar Newport str. SHSN011]|nr:Hypothetical protein K801_12116 [Salmonella enterica subsp. enterica serovar Newport str. SHSN011]
MHTDRFIPAGAGNTNSGRSNGCPIAVYPRWRGEHEGLEALPEAEHGLSPLARGTPSPEFCPATTTRFIPAGAGNTGRNSKLWHQPAVYPRWRGEHD